MTETMPASSPMAEKAVLSTMLSAPRSIAEIQLIITSEDFYYPAHALLFDTIVELAETHKVDPVLVSQTLIQRGQFSRAGGTALLAELITNTYALPDNVGIYAMRIRELQRVRRFRQMLERGMQVVGETERGFWESQRRGNGEEVDLDRLQDVMASILLEGDILVDEKLADQSIPGLSKWTEFLAVPDHAQDWLVPDLIEQMDVWMILGGEGGGKSWFDRQMVLTLGAGIHPFLWERRITPVCSLLIDCENADSMIRRQSRAVYGQATHVGDFAHLNDNAYIWRQQAGLNLRNKTDQLLFQSAIEKTRPKFIGMGSLYNMFQKGRDDWETAAEEVKDFLNKMRARYEVALLIEHHMPKGGGQDDRPATPYGSSVWQRWVTHGYVLNRMGLNLWEFTAFRGDRDARQVPMGLQRGGMFPWSPIYDRGDFDAMLELEEAQAAPRPRRR